MQGVYRRSAQIDQHSASYFAYIAACSRRRRMLAFARRAGFALLAALPLLAGAALLDTLGTPPVARSDELETLPRCYYDAQCYIVNQESLDAQWISCPLQLDTCRGPPRPVCGGVLCVEWQAALVAEELRF